MGSYIQIDSISIDLSNSIDKRDAGKCEHFSIRGYVSEMRKKDWKSCWPFPVNESDGQPSLPPLDVPKYMCRRCQNTPEEVEAKDIQKGDQKDIDGCSCTGCRSGANCINAALKSGNQHDPMVDTLERREIDLNTNLSSVNDYLQINEKEKNAAVVPSRTIDLEIGVEDDLNHQLTNIPSPKNYPDNNTPEMHTTKRGCEGNEASLVELACIPKCMDKSAAEMCNGETPANSQCQKDLTKACTIFGEGTTMEIGNMYNHAPQPPLESVACHDAVPPVASTVIMVENDFQDHHLEKSSGLSRRRPRKVRLMTDLLSEHGELKTEENTMQESSSHGTSNASAASQGHSIVAGKMDIQGDLTLTTGPSGKRKFLAEEVRRRPASVCFGRVENEVPNLEVDAKTIDTVMGTRSNSKDVPARSGLQESTKGRLNKAEIERSHIGSKKKNKKIQVVDNRLIPKPPQGQQRENEGSMDTADKACASKSLSSKLAPCAFTGKQMDNFPNYTLRMENEFNLSKDKGKMLQIDGEMNSLSCQKNNMLLKDSFAYSGERTRAVMPVAIPNPSAQGGQNGKGPEEGLHLSLNSYLAAHGYNKKCIREIDNRPPFSLPFQEGTSKVLQLNRKDSDVIVFGEPSIHSKHPANALSGQGVHCEEINGERNTQKNVEAVDKIGVMKRYGEQAVEVSEQGALDDIPMEIVELLAKNQYERCLPDVENRNFALENSTIGRKAQMISGSTVHSKGEMSLLKEGPKEKPQGRPKKSIMATRGETSNPNKRKPVHYYGFEVSHSQKKPFDGNSLRLNNLCPPQSPFGFEVSHSQKKPSTGFQFSPMGSSQLGGARNCGLSGSFEERGYSNANLQAAGGCNLHKNILQQDDEASRIWASLNPNHVSLGYDLPKKAVSHANTNSSVDIASLRSGPFHKQNMKRDIDLNSMNLNAAGMDKLGRNTGPGTFGRINGEYAFPCKHNAMEPHQSLRGSLDLYSNETIPAMHLLSLMDAGMQSHAPYDGGVNAQMLKRPSYPGDCNTKLEIGTSKAHGALKRPSSDYYSRAYLSDKPHGCFVGSPTYGASSSTQYDKKLVRPTGFNGQDSTKSGRKEKLKTSNGTLQNTVNKQFSWPRLETEASLQRKLNDNGTNEIPVPYKIISGNPCMVNKNPADFTIPETGNIYMIRGEDLKFEKSTPKNRPRIPIPRGYKQQKNLKGTKMKEH